MEHTWMFSDLVHSFKCWLHPTRLILWPRAKNTALVSPSWSSTSSFNCLLAQTLSGKMSSFPQPRWALRRVLGIILPWDLSSSAFPSPTPQRSPAATAGLPASPLSLTQNTWNTFSPLLPPSCLYKLEDPRDQVSHIWGGSWDSWRNPEF